MSQGFGQCSTRKRGIHYPQLDQGSSRVSRASFRGGVFPRTYLIKSVLSIPSFPKQNIRYRFLQLVPQDLLSIRIKVRQVNCRLQQVCFTLEFKAQLLANMTHASILRQHVSDHCVNTLFFADGKQVA